MKHKILKTSLSLLIVSCTFNNISITSATNTQNDIPEIMQPYTIIEYTSNSDSKVIKGGFLKGMTTITHDNIGIDGARLY